MVATKNHLKERWIEGSRHDVYTVLNAAENSIVLAKSKNKVIGDSHFFSPVNTISKQHMQNVSERGGGIIDHVPKIYQI